MSSNKLFKGCFMIRVPDQSHLRWKRCVSDMFDINVFVLYVSGIICFRSFVASNICELFLWQDKGNLFQRGHTFDEILHWMPQCGEKYGILCFCTAGNSKVLTPQVWRHHVFRFTFYNMSNFMFSERTYFDRTPTSKIWLCGTEKLKLRATSKFLP